ncbi:MAG: sugar ABC transporter ATP-binding protein [Eubacteriales bacterium]
MQSDQSIFLSLKNVTKSFPGVLALNQVSLEVKSGTVLALVGENGAGKSTLMKILSGVYHMDSGEIYISGEKVEISSPLSSQHMGISIIYQELNSLLNMNIAENVFIGRETRKRGLIDKKLMHEKTKELLHKVGLDIDTWTMTNTLSTAQKQMIEVAKALSFNARLIIMDEPTSSLTDTETNTLFDIVRRLKSNGVAVIFITHRLKEIFEISDEVAVMRDGEMVTTFITAQTNENEIINNMVGRDVKNIFAKEAAEISDVLLEVKNLSTKGLLRDINFKVHKGEILGFAGLVGAGRSEVMRAVFGIDRRETGDIYINGQKVIITNTVDAIKNGLGFVPEDRKEQGLILKMNITKNISMAALENFRKRGLIDKKREKKEARKYIESLQIKTPSEDQIVANLSGGNQQKVVIGKWMEIKPRILILDEPTRGIDVKTKKEIYMLMSKLAQQGVAIIMISSELPEILGMADRIVVMHEGTIKGELLRKEATQESIMKLAMLN